MTENSRWSPTTKRVVIAVLVAGLFFVVWQASEIVRPFVWAAILGYVLGPVVTALERRFGLSRTIAAAAVYAAVLAVVLLAFRLLLPLVSAELFDLRRTAPTLAGNAQRSLNDILADYGIQGIDLALLTADAGGTAARMAIPIAAALLRTTLEFLLFLIATYFFLRDGPRLGDFLKRQIPRSHRREIVPLISDVNALLGRYVRGQILLVVIMSTVTTIGLTLLNVPYSVLLGIITGVLETIPIVGPITAGALASLVALGHPNPFGWSQLAYVGVVVVMYTVLRHAEDYFVIPLVIGRIVKLHPLVVIFSLLAGGAIFGLLGILLAVPAAATLRLVLIYVRAKLRDEDAFPQVQRAVAEAEESIASDVPAAVALAREPDAR